MPTFQGELSVLPTYHFPSPCQEVPILWVLPSEWDPCGLLRLLPPIPMTTRGLWSLPRSLAGSVCPCANSLHNQSTPLWWQSVRKIRSHRYLFFFHLAGRYLISDSVCFWHKKDFVKCATFKSIVSKWTATLSWCVVNILKEWKNWSCSPN